VVGTLAAVSADQRDRRTRHSGRHAGRCIGGSARPAYNTQWSARWPLYRRIGATGVQHTVVGTLGNLLVIGSLGGSVRCRNPRTVGKIFIVNLACSDLIVTSVINPMAIAGTPPRADHTADTPPPV